MKRRPFTLKTDTRTVTADALIVATGEVSIHRLAGGLAAHHRRMKQLLSWLAALGVCGSHARQGRAVTCGVAALKVGPRAHHYSHHAWRGRGVRAGASARRLHFPGADALWQRGISACAICDGTSPLCRCARARARVRGHGGHGGHAMP